MSATDQKGERSWIERMAELEDEAGGFPNITATMALRRRGVAVESTEYKSWSDVESSIRPDVPTDFLVQLKREVEEDRGADALRTIWLAVVRDLKRKLKQYGVEYVALLPSVFSYGESPNLDSISEHKLIVACEQLGILDEEARVKLGYCWELVKGNESGTISPPDRLELLNFIKNCVKHCLSVEGKPPPGADVKHLPDALLVSSVKRDSQALLDAHNGFNNFYQEVEPARKLATYGSAIPGAARETYTKAVVQCFLGNLYGVSYKAEPYIIEMIDGFDEDLIRRSVALVESDPDLRVALMSPRPAERLKLLLQRFEPLVSNKLSEWLTVRRYLDMDPVSIAAEFSKVPSERFLTR